MVTVLGQWSSWRVEGLGYCCDLSWAEILMLHGGSCWSETRLWSMEWHEWHLQEKMASAGMGCDYACWYHGMKGNGSIHQAEGQCELL